MSDNFDEFEKQFEPDPGVDYKVMDTGIGLHIFDLWEHLAMHFAVAAHQAREEGKATAGTYMLSNGVTLSFLFKGNDVYAWAQYPPDVVAKLAEELSP